MTQACAANLPVDILEIVFAQAFEGREQELHAGDALRLWGTLLLVCRRWKEALSRIELELRLAVTHSDDAKALLLSWLQRVKLVALRIDSKSMPTSFVLGDAVPNPNRWVDLELVLPDAEARSWGVSHLLLLPRLTRLCLRNLRVLDLHTSCPTLQHLDVQMPQDSPAEGHPPGWGDGMGADDDFGQPRFISLHKQPSLRTFRLRVQGALALQLGQLTHTCEDVSVEATTILLGVEQTEGSPGVDLFSRPYEEGDFVPPHIWGDAAALEASHRACEDACAQLIHTLGREDTELKTLRLASDVSFKIIPADRGATTFKAYMARMFPVFLEALPIMYGFQAQGLADEWSVLCGCALPETRVAAELARLAFSALDQNEVSITIGPLPALPEE